MRKLSLFAASGLLVSAGAAGVAQAQTPPATTYTVVSKAAIPTPPAPGTIAVSLGGLFQWFLGGGFGNGYSYKGQKLENYTQQGFARLYFGMDGQSTNGILYGTAFQIRQNFGTSSGSGVAPSSGSGGSTLYVRTGYAYIGTPTGGTLKVGATGGPITAFAAGMFEGFNDGGWNGDVPAFVPSNVQPLYPYEDNGVLYTTDKISYFSPRFAGFDFGVGYEPSFVTLNNSTSCSDGAAGALSTCDDLSSSNVAGDAEKRRQTVDIAARYRGTFGPAGVLVSGGWLGSGVVNETGTTTTGAADQRFHGLSVGHIGTEITVAGLTFGGNFSGGAENGQWGLQPDGGKGATFYMVGAQYAIGPLIVGGSYFNNQNQGDYTGLTTKGSTEGQRVEYGVAAGGTYSLTPGIGFYLAYLYGDRKQSGYDFLAGSLGTTNNEVHSQAIGVGITTQW
jgi:hypothetical protein